MKFAIILTLFAVLALAHSSDSKDLEKSFDTQSPVIKAADDISPDKETETGDLDAQGSFISIGLGGGWGGYGGGYGGGWGRGYGGYGRGYGGGWGRGYGGYGRRFRGGGWGWGK